MRARMSFGTPLEKCCSASVGKTHDLKSLSSLSGGDGSFGTRLHAYQRRRFP